MAHPSNVQWGRIVLGGVLAEVGILLVAIPVSFLPSGERALLWAVPPACLVMTFVAAVLFIAATWSQTLPLAYVVSHGLKVVGGAAGGLAAARLPPQRP